MVHGTPLDAVIVVVGCNLIASGRFVMLCVAALRWVKMSNERTNKMKKEKKKQKKNCKQSLYSKRASEPPARYAT